MKTSVFSLISVATLLTLMTAHPALAQIELDTNGNVSLNGSLSGPLGGLEVTSSVHMNHRLGVGTTSATEMAIIGQSDQPAGIYVHGVRGEAKGQGSHHAYGVRGEAEDATTTYGIYGSASGSDAYAGYFTGDIYVAGNVQNSSDERFKQNIQLLERGDMLRQIVQLQPRSYEHHSESQLQSETGLPALNLDSGEQMGLVAQELEEVFPELVSDITHVINEKEILTDEQEPETVTTKAVDYNGLIIVLIAAMQEQQAQIEELEQQIQQ